MTPANAETLRRILLIQGALEDLNTDLIRLLEGEENNRRGYDKLLKKINEIYISNN